MRKILIFVDKFKCCILIEKIIINQVCYLFYFSFINLESN